MLDQYARNPAADAEIVFMTVPSAVDLASVRVVVDPFNDVLESDETNNSVRVDAAEH